MTVIIGLVHERKAYLVADSLSADQRGVWVTTAMPKIVRVPGPALGGYCPSLLFGFTTSWRFGQVAEQALMDAGWKASRMDRQQEGPELLSGEKGMPWPGSRASWAAREDEPADYVRLWLIGWMVPALREALKAAAWSEVKDNVQKGGYALLAIAGRLFRVQQDFSVAENACGYDAVGAGEEVAMGALAATADIPLVPAERIRRVAAAVERHMVWVRGPWRTEET